MKAILIHFLFTEYSMIHQIRIPRCEIFNKNLKFLNSLDTIALSTIKNIQLQHSLFFLWNKFNYLHSFIPSRHSIPVYLYNTKYS